MNIGSNVSIPLWLLYEDEIEGWRARQAPLARQWLGEQNFKAEKHRVVLLPDSGGGIACAVAGLGKRQGELSLWHAAGLAERLPARRFHFAQEFNAAEATQLALGFAYGAYRFDRYRSCKSELASLEPPSNADMALRRQCRGVAAHGARLDQYAGRRFRACAAGCRGAPGGRPPSGWRSRNGSGRIFWPQIFPRFTPWDARAARHRAWLNCAGRPRAERRIRASRWSGRGCVSTAAVWISNRAPAWLS